MLQIPANSAFTKVAAIVTVAAAAVALTSCNRDGGDSPRDVTPQANIDKAQAAVDEALQPPDRITQTEPLPAAPVKGGKVVVTTDGLPDSLRINKGVEQAAEAVGWEFVSVSKDAANPASLQSSLMNALSENPTVVTESGNPQSQFSESLLKAYAKADVPIVLDSTYPVEATNVIIGSSENIPDGYEYNKALAKTLADWFIADSEGEGTAIIENVSGYPSLTGVPDGFKAEVDALCPGCKVEVVDVSLADLGAGKLQDTVISAIRREKADYVFFDNGAFAAGINSKMQAAGLGDVKIGGVSPQAESIQALKDGTQQAWMGIGFNYVGWAAMDLVFRHLQGVDLTTNNAVQPTQLLTKDNAEEGLWELPGDGLEQFKALWQVSDAG